MTNRDSLVGTNSGATLLDLKGGKVFLLKDVIFDQGENFRLYWSAV
jgi:hypothetical protein